MEKNTEFQTSSMVNLNDNQKGWSSERVPFPVTGIRRRISAGGGGGGMTPFSSGRALPSKWEDAERWITSPVYGYSKGSSYQGHRRPVSKSGPVGQSGSGPYSPAAMAVAEGGGGCVRNYMVAGSPFLTGVILTEADGVSSGRHPYLLHNDHNIPHSDIVHECSDLLSQSPSSPRSQDEKNVESGVVSRRDMATQMSPEGSTSSSLKGWTSSPIVAEPNQQLSTKTEMRDVQVDKWATVLRQWSKRYGGRTSRKYLTDVEDLFRNAERADEQAWPWDVADAAKKFQRDEAKITAWENLQKAKADAAIKKLEMKLERKRSSSMDKILKKLRKAETKAQEMRRASSEKLAFGVYKNKNVKMDMIRSCFTSHSSA